MATGSAPAVERAGQEAFEVGACAENMIAVAHALRVRYDELLRAMNRQAALRLAAAGFPARGQAQAAAFEVLSAATDIVITLITSDRLVSPEEATMLGTLAARKARQGFPHHASRLTVSVALSVAWEAAVEAVGALPPSHATTVALGRIGVILGRMADALPLFLATRSAPRGPGGVLAQLFAELLSAEGDAEIPRGELLRRGLEPAGRYGAVLLAPAEPDADREGVRAAACDLLQSIPSSIDVPVSSPTTSHRTIVFSDAAERWSDVLSAADAAAKPRSVIALCAPPTDTRTLVGAYQRCVHLIGVARRMRALPGLVDLRQLRVPALLNVPYDDRQRFLGETLGPVLALPERQRRPLLTTLLALRNAPTHGGASAAARALHVHVKTVYYRLERIRELTGLDHDAQSDRLELALAVELLRFPDAGGTLDSPVRSATLTGAVVPFPSARR
jgi:hypothetical protein